MAWITYDDQTAAAPPGGTGSRSGSSARRVRPATGLGLRSDQRPPDGLHVSSQTDRIRRWRPVSSAATPKITLCA